MIAVISDSHIPDRADSIPEEFQVKMKDADKVFTVETLNQRKFTGVLVKTMI